MRRLMRAGWREGIVVLLVATTLTGCGGDGAPPTATVVVTPTPPATPTGIGDIVWTTAVDPATSPPTEQLQTLPRDASQVIAALPIGTLPAGTTIQAHWTIDGDRLPELDPDPVTVTEGRADAWVAWTLRWTGDQPWPLGHLGIVVEINGTVVREAQLPIVRAGD